MDFAELGFKADSRDLKGTTTDLDKMGKAGVTAGRNIDNLSATAKKGFGVVALAAGAALGAMAGLGATIQTIRQFDSSMSKLGAVTGATTDQLTDMRDVARDLGATTEFSATQAADGLTFLGMAGFTAAESMASISSVLDLATASGMGLAEAADTASNIMSGFGIAAEDAADVSDVLAAASSRANTDVSQLGQAMSTVAPIAAALDIDLADTAATIGVLSDAGIQGSRAGTALRGVLASLAGPTTEAESVLAQLGLTIGDVDPATNALSDVMGKLGDAGLTTSQAMTIFGREAASGALVLVEGSDRLREFGAELGNVDGAAADMAATMRDNLGGDIDGLQSAVAGLMISLGDAGLTAILRGVVAGLTGITRAVSAAVDGFGSIAGSFADFINQKSALAQAVDNATLAMGDEIGQANALFTLMGTGATVTQSVAVAKLSEARAHLGNAEALKDEADAAAALQLVQLQLRYDELREGLTIIKEGTDGYHEQELLLRDVLLRMSDIRGIQQETNSDYQAARDEIVRIQTAIDGAVDGMVTFDGEVITAVELTERLSDTAGGINFDAATASAARLAAQLGVSLEIAARMNALGPQANEGGAGRGRGGDPRTQGGSFLDYQVRDADAFLANYQAPQISAGGGGSSRSSGGGRSGVSEAQREAERQRNEDMRAAEIILNGLMSAQDEYNDALDQANRLLDVGVLPMEAYTEHVAQLGAELADSKFGDLRQDVDRFTDALFEGQDAVKDFFRTMVIEAAKVDASNAFKSLLGIGGQAATGGLGDLFAGFFDSGGNIPSGQFGVVAERRPEFANGVLIPGPANITGGAETAKMLGSQSTTININVTGATGNGEIRSMVTQGVQAGMNQVRQEVPNIVNQYQMEEG